MIYVQPLGKFTPAEKKIVAISAEFMGAYFQLPVKIREGLPLDAVPKSARRKPGKFRSEQFLTTHVLYDILKPRLPRDAVTFIGFTAADLWPGKGWNYVFGQASLGDRVGVWSINRFGNADRDEESFRRCLLRTLKTATHETAHMFSMAHCTLYRMQHGRMQSSERGRPPPLVALPTLPRQTLLRHRRRSGQEVRESRQVLQSVRAENGAEFLRKIAGLVAK